VLQHAVDIFDDIGVPISQNGNAARGKPSVATLVSLDFRRQVVLTAVEFDGEAKSRAIEIEHVRADGVLAPKSMAIDLTAA